MRRRRHTVFAFAALAALAGATLPANAQFNFGRLLDAARGLQEASVEPGEKQELEIGRQWAATLLGAAPLVADPELQRYVNTLGRWLALHSSRPELAWQFGVLDSPNVNAFATPGGFVFVTRGLLLRLRSEAELAGVLAHEIAHVAQRHHMKAIQSQAGIRAGTGVVSELVVQGRGGIISERLLAGIREVMLRGLDKTDELEADRIGVVIAARAGYDPWGLAGVLQTLAATNARDPGLALLFATHPPPGERLETLERVMTDRLDRFATSAESKQFARRVQALR